MAYVFVFLEGIIAFISPCILPMFPVYVMYLTGKSGSENELTANRTREIDRNKKGDRNNAEDRNKEEYRNKKGDRNKEEDRNKEGDRRNEEDRYKEEDRNKEVDKDLGGIKIAEPMSDKVTAISAAISPDNAGKRANKLIANTLGFILGFMIIFVLLGATATWVGNAISDNKLLIQKISGVIIILFGLNFTGLLKIPFLDKERRFRVNASSIGFFSSILFGAAFSFGWSPCLGTFLGAAFMLAANAGTVYEGMLMLLLFSLGLGIPFFICAIIIDRMTNVFNFVKKHYHIINIASGVLLIIAGLALVFNVFDYWASLFDLL